MLDPDTEVASKEQRLGRAVGWVTCQWSKVTSHESLVAGREGRLTLPHPPPEGQVRPGGAGDDCRLIKRWVERAVGPVPGEIEEEGGIDGRMQRKRWGERLVRPTEQGTQGFFGRLAVRRPATLPLWPSIDRPTGAAVRYITQSGAFSHAPQPTCRMISRVGTKDVGVSASDLRPEIEDLGVASLPDIINPMVACQQTVEL
jgi:hypothetical protein